MTILAGDAIKLQIDDIREVMAGDALPINIENLITYLATQGIAPATGATGIFSVTIPEPENPSDTVIGRTYDNITVTELVAVVVGAGSTITLNVEYGPNIAIAGTDLFTADEVISNTTTGETFIAFDNPNIPANSWVRLTVSGITGTVDSISLSFKYTVT